MAACSTQDGWVVGLSGKRIQADLEAMQEGSEILFTIRTANVAQRETTGDITAINVSYDAFVDDIQVRAFCSKPKERFCSIATAWARIMS